MLGKYGVKFKSDSPNCIISIIYAPKISSIVNDELFDMDLVGYLPYIQVEGYFKGRINLSGLNLNTKITFNATLRKFDLRFGVHG